MLLVDFQLPAKSKHGGKDKLVHKALAQKAVAQLVAPHFPQRPILKALNSLLNSCPPFNTRTFTFFWPHVMTVLLIFTPGKINISTFG